MTTKDLSYHEVIDDSGNKLYFNNGSVYLKMKAWSQAKQIGALHHVNGAKVYFKLFRPWQHVFKKNNSVGINYGVIQNLADNDYIALRHATTGETKYVSIEQAKKNGSFLHFKDQGFERQLFIPLSCFSDTPPNPENSKAPKEKVGRLVGASSSAT